MRRHCIVIAQGYPRADNGFGLAMISSLRLYEHFFDRVTYASVTHEQASQASTQPFPQVEFVHVPIVLHSPKRRFLASMPTGLPASVTQMNTQAVQKRVVSLVEAAVAGSDQVWCIVENFSPSQFIPVLRQRFPQVTVVYRAHDVSAIAFEPFARIGSAVTRFSWKWELARIRRLEAKSAASANHVWAITSEDAASIEKLYGRPCEGVHGVQLDLARYAKVEPGPLNRVLYLGSSDIRKAQGLLRFIDECWPRVRREMPDVELWIGGAGTERFGNPGAGIQAFGAVDDERAFLGMGRTLINPQEAGTGIKLKSLVALAAGKLLVSTHNGVMGIEGGEPGKHFVASDPGGQMAAGIALLRSNPQKVEDMAAAGRRLMLDNYDLHSAARHRENFRELLGTRAGE